MSCTSPQMSRSAVEASPPRILPHSPPPTALYPQERPLPPTAGCERKPLQKGPSMRSVPYRPLTFILAFLLLASPVLAAGARDHRAEPGARLLAGIWTMVRQLVPTLEKGRAGQDPDGSSVPGTTSETPGGSDTDGRAGQDPNG